MKKIIVVVASAMLLMAAVSQADISVNLGIIGGILNHGGTAYPADLWAGGGLMQLVWTAVGSAYSPSQISNPAGEEPGALPGYYILWSGTLGDINVWPDDQDGSVDYLDSDVGGANINAGWIYARVFEIALPVEGTWYASSLIYDTSAFNESTNVPKPLPDDIDVTQGPNSFFDDGAQAMMVPLDHGQVTLVPEPSTLALALAGVGLLVYRRFRK